MNKVIEGQKYQVTSKEELGSTFIRIVANVKRNVWYAMPTIENIVNIASSLEAVQSAGVVVEKYYILSPSMFTEILMEDVEECVSVSHDFYVYKVVYTTAYCLDNMCYQVDIDVHELIIKEAPEEPTFRKVKVEVEQTITASCDVYIPQDAPDCKAEDILEYWVQNYDITQLNELRCDIPEANVICTKEDNIRFEDISTECMGYDECETAYNKYQQATNEE